jgi:hypothetical protein
MKLYSVSHLLAAADDLLHDLAVLPWILDNKRSSSNRWKRKKSLMS